MPRVAHVWPEAPRRAGDAQEIAGRIEWPLAWPKVWKERRRAVAFGVPADLTVSAVAIGDAFLLGTLFGAMRRARVLHVHAPIGASRAESLTRLQRLWVERRPDKYRVVEIRADAVVPEEAPSGPALLSFSGGLDSAYTLFRRTEPGARVAGPPLGAALMVAGPDIPIEERAGFAEAFAKARRMTESRGVPLLVASTTLRRIPHSWSHGSAAGLGAVMTLFRGRFGAGILASGLTLEESPRFWPQDATDPPLVSSPAFPVVPDGDDVDRFEKMAALEGWPEAFENLRVCYEPGHWGRNCGECVKCLTTAFFARVVWGRRPAFMPRDVTLDDARSLASARRYPTIRLRLLQLVRHARARGVREPWLPALEEALADGTAERTVA